MTMADFKMLSQYWSDHPPAHLMIAGYLGIKPRKRQPEDHGELIGFFRAQSGWTVH